MAAQTFYPNIGTIVTIDNFPEELQFLESGLQNALEKIFYKEFYCVKSKDGSRGYYNLILVTNEEVKFEIPGTGFSVILNPGILGETQIPLVLNYNWPIISYIGNFNINEFSYTPDQLQNVLSRTFKLSPIELVMSSVQIFEETNDIEGYISFVGKINTYYSLSGGNSLPYPEEDEDFKLANEVLLAILNSSITDELSVIINNVYIFSDFVSNYGKVIRYVTGDSLENYAKSILIPSINANLLLSLGLAFPREILKPVNPVTGDVLEEPAKSILNFNAGTLAFSTSGGISFQQEMTVSLNPSQIGNTGLIIDILNAKLDLSKNSNIIEADLDGRPQDFIGIYAQYVSITLPSKWFNNVDGTTLRIAGYNMLIGTGGISGTIALETVNGTPNINDDYLTAKIGNWEIGFNAFDITFKQNTVTSSNIRARLTFPKFNNPSTNQPLQIDVLGHLFENGDFNLTASVEGGIEAKLFDFVNFNFLTLELGKENTEFYVGTSCEIWFTNPIMTKLIGDQKIVLPSVRIYSDGSFEIVGGNAFIPANISLDLGPVDVAVTGIHFGSYQQNGRKYNYWGFDGSISINPLGLDARGEGIKYYYSVDDGPRDNFIRIQTIEVDLIIPGTASPAAAMAIIHGMISIPQPGDSPEYVGEVTFKLPKASMAGGAAMKFAPRSPAFIIDANVDLPAPIPIGPVGIYGFRGLLGFRYVAEKEAVGLVSGVNTWYDYYKFPPRGIHVSKFSQPNETKNYSFPFSIGVGAVLGTSFDSGTIISIRAMMVLSLPTLFMIDGRASIISARLGLDDNREPPFFAFVAWGDNSMEMGMGADFKLPQSTGKILSLQAQVESRFIFNNSSAWYVNIGTKTNPNTATVFKDLINLRALSYLMMAAQGIEAGARVDFELKKSFFGIKVEIYAFVEMGARVSFERPQLGGYLHFGGGIKVNVWKLLLANFDINAYLSAEAVKPFLIFAKLEFKGSIRVFRFLKIRFSIKLQLKWEVSSEINTQPVRSLPTADTQNNILDRTKELVKGVHMLTNETYDLKYLGINLLSVNQADIIEIIPVDTFIDIKSTKGLIGNAISAKIGGYTSAPKNYTDLIPPRKTVAGGLVLRQVKHEYSIEDLEIKAWNGSTWENYHPYEALIPAGPNRDAVSGFRVGYWQQSNNQYDTIRLLATTPFSYLDAGEPGWFIPEYYGITPSTLFCQVEEEQMKTVNVLNKALGATYNYNAWNAHYINGAYFNVTGGYDFDVPVAYNGVTVDALTVTDVANLHNFAQSLSFTNYNSLIITLPEDTVYTELLLTSNSQGVKIKYYRAVNNPGFSQVQFELVSEVSRTQSQLSGPVIYDSPSQAIIKIIVEPITPVDDQINAIREQIEALFTDSYSSLDGIVNVSLPNDILAYDSLLRQLQELISTGCGFESGNPCKDKDEKLCDIYETLTKDYCFRIVTSPKDMDMKCYEAFSNSIKDMDVNYPGLISMLEPYYGTYLKYLQTLGDMIRDGAKPEDIIRVYEQMYATADEIMQAIYINGDCGCGDPCKDMDEKLCDVYETLIKEYCFMPITTPKELDMMCYEAFSNSIKDLDVNYPGLISMLEPYYGMYLKYLQTLANMIRDGAKPEDIIKVYEQLYAAAHEMMQVIYVSGDCGCATNTDPGSERLCITSFQQLRYLSVESYTYNSLIPGTDAQMADQLAMVAAVEHHVQPIWRPNTKYYIRFTLKDTITNGTAVTTGIDNYFYGFQTSGVVGHYSPDTSLQGRNTLAPYIDFNRSYPNAGGNLLQAKPIFWGHHECKITLFFIKPYTYHMLREWPLYKGMDPLQGAINIKIKDPVSGTYIDYPLPAEVIPYVPVPENNGDGNTVWALDEIPLSPAGLTVLNNLIEAANLPCILHIGEALVPASYAYKVQLTNLLPQKLYTALVYNAFDANSNGALSDNENVEIHNFVFQTSRYENFISQVNSYLLSDGDTERAAIFKLSVSLGSVAVGNAYAVVSGENLNILPELSTRYSHAFDRVLEGILLFKPLEFPATTEFNVIRNDQTGNIIAILVRNPEPFNNPKIPLSEIPDTLVVLDAQGQPDISYKVLLSKDYSQAIIMKVGNLINSPSLLLRFSYKIWNGNAYSQEGPYVPVTINL